MTDLSGRSALVTGSSHGIGRGIAMVLAAQGAQVVVHGRDPQGVREVQRAIEGAGGTALGVLADLTDPDAVERMRDTVVSAWGTPDIVVANAGGNPVRPGPIEQISVSDWNASQPRLESSC